MSLVVRLMVPIALTIAVLPAPAEACLWDYDTLKEEALGQNEIAEVVGGRLRKHALSFYQAKVTYTETLVAAGTVSAAVYDDLAVALAKVGKTKEALATLDAKEKKFPGEYTTLANRGTFLLVGGDLDGGLIALRKAVEMNPNAHFGREKYQIQLIEYLQKLAKDKAIANKQAFFEIDVGGADGFGASRSIMKISSSKAKKRQNFKSSEAAIAITGLIRFGEGQDNPHLWWGLGWALVAQGDAQLAARAFRRAELLGHPRGQADGAHTLSALHGKAGCCGELDARKLKQWTDAAAGFDKEWAKGQALDTTEQKREDTLIARKQFKKVFGY